MTRPQPRKLIVPAVFFILVPALAAFASAWIVRGEPARLVPLITKEWTVWLVAACVLLAAWVLFAYCLARLLTWHGTRYILTSRRIIARYGLLRRRNQQASLASVRNVDVIQSVLQRILRSGNISLDTGHMGGMVVPDVPEVDTFRSYLLDAIDDLPAAELLEINEFSDFTDDELPWEMREGGGDER